MDTTSATPVLTSALAQEIAGDTSAIIGFNVLITDRDGTVIGSGDRGRVGSFHEASLEVIRTMRPATHSAAQARALQGVRPGITLPIVLGDTALGTVGITGSPGQVRRFGLVVKRQTEILLKEAVVLRSRLLRERALEDLVRDIAYFDANVVEPEMIAFRAAELGYDLNIARVVVVVDVVAQPGGGELADSGPSTHRLALLQTLRTTFTEIHDVVAAMPSDRFVALHRIAPSGPGNAGGRDELRTRCHRVVEQIQRLYGLSATAGIGATARTVAGLHASYLDASSALRLGVKLAANPRARAGGRSPDLVDSDAQVSSAVQAVHAIEDLRIHQMLAEIGHGPRARFVEALTADVRAQADWPVLRQTVLAWCESGFNLVRAAGELHIHRNTLVYRLDKIAHLTGKSARDHPAALALYLACLVDNLDDSSREIR